MSHLRPVGGVIRTERLHMLDDLQYIPAQACNPSETEPYSRHLVLQGFETVINLKDYLHDIKRL